MIIDNLGGLKERIESTLPAAGCPALSMAIVNDNEVIFAEGFGLRNVEKGLPATADTLYNIGSCTKAFTAMAAAMMVEQGRLEWDTPIRKYLPSFRMYDPVATERLTLRDLLTHRSGLCAHDGVWYNNPIPREELIDSIQYLEPCKDFREVFQYNNLLYMLAGYLAGKAAGMTWEELVQQRIFQPLGMARSNFSTEQTRADQDHALPYQMLETGISPEPFPLYESIGPAGNIYTSAAEMAIWLQLNLNHGTYGDIQLLSPSLCRQIFTPQIVAAEQENGITQDYIFHTLYAMGWLTGTYRGHEVFWHGGIASGFRTCAYLLPRDGIGIVSICNLLDSSYAWVMALEAIDLLLGLEVVDWNARMHTALAKKVQEAEEHETKIEAHPPTHSWDAFPGVYMHPGYGSCQVSTTGDGLILQLHGMDLPLKHCNYNVFELFGFGFKTQFHMDSEGVFSYLSIAMQPGVKDIVFERLPEKA